MTPARHRGVVPALQSRELESRLKLADEASIEGLIGSDALMWLANVYYVSMHLPVMIGFLLIGYLFRPWACSFRARPS